MRRSHAPAAIGAAVLVMAALLAAVPEGVPDSPQWTEAERLRAEGSYALALERYRQVPDAGLTQDQRRWLDLRLADAAWRAEQHGENPDPTTLETARERLEALARQPEREEQRDRVWAEAHESLGDLHWHSARWGDWGTGWPHYEQALSWWASSRDVATARERWLAMVRKAAEPRWAPRGVRYPDFGGQIPLTVAEDALAVAREPADVALARYLVAVALYPTVASVAQYERAVAAFEAAAVPEPGNVWRDDALWQYAQFVQSPGRPVRLRDGTLGRQPDYERAVEVLRRLVSDYGEGQSRWREAAVRQIDEITAPSLDVAVANVFVPGSEIEYTIAWRNLDTVAIRLVPTRLAADVDPTRAGGRDWVESIDLAGKRPERTWTLAAPEAGKHVPHHRVERLETPLAPGAYVLEASGGSRTARALVLVTRGAVVLSTRGQKGLAFVTDAFDGTPRPSTEIVVWQGVWNERGRTQVWTSSRMIADADGLAKFDLVPATGRATEILALGGPQESQAVAAVHSWRSAPDRERWAVYAFADRPAYRPGDAVRWKWIARVRTDAGYRTPAGVPLLWTITDPQGAEVASGTAEPSLLGSAWGELTLPARSALGEYSLSLAMPSTGVAVARTSLFRVEEYRLPEFRVDVLTPKDDQGRPRSFRAGETVSFEVAAEYYFGGPVSGGEVEAVVVARRFVPWWRPPTPYPWLHDTPEPISWFGPGDTVRRLRGTLDAAGRARFSLPTAEHGDVDLTYTIEARVVDASRREITGTGSVRVTRQRYFAHLDSGHRVVRPNDVVRVQVRTLDPNDAPVAARGTVVVARERFEEIWIDPWGRNVEGPALDRARREAAGAFPPPAPPGRPEWRPLRRGVRRETVREATVTTDADGRAEFTFTPDREGLYRVTWDSEPEDLWPVHAETSVWVATSTTAGLQVRPEGVRIVVDRDTFRPGETAPVLITAPWPGAAVLFSVDPDDLHAARVVRLTGDAKLVELPIEARHVPNVFLEATAVLDLAVLRDVEEVQIPAADRFLEVEIDPGEQPVEPGATRTVTVRTRDREGRPVAAEVALGVVDEAVYAIQPDYAPDPRPFFFGERRPNGTAVGSSFDRSPYVRLEPKGPEDDRPELPEPFAVGDLAVRSVAMAEASTGAVRSKAEMADAQMAAAPTMAAAPSEPAQAALQVRADFRATAYWKPDVVTGADGTATVSVPYPESLTAWTAKARAVADGDRVGLGEARARTAKPLAVRVHTPRFLVAGDVAVVSATIHNSSSEAMRVRPALTAEGVTLEERLDNQGDLDIPAGGEGRAEWRVRAIEPGAARVVAEARSERHGDAVERRFPVEEHGIDKLVARAGKMRAAEAVVSFDLPPSRRPGSTALVVQVTPSAAAVMLDALPYLLEYPYGCTEQTLSRFLPAVIVRRATSRLGVEPRGLGQLDDIAASGTARLADSQRSDGAWGWWPESEADPFMTAYAVWGLSEGLAAGVPYDRGRLADAARWLETHLVELDPDLRAFALHALSTYAQATGRAAPTPLERTALEASWSERDRLSAYGRALTALAHHRLGERERAQVLARNLVNGAIRDDAPDRSVIVRGSGSNAPEVQATAHWGSRGIAWHWHSGAVESTAFALRALLAIDPASPLVEPAANWLVRNRTGARWSNTRDTAIAVLALTDWLERTGELSSAASFAISVNGLEIARRALDAASGPSRFEVETAILRDGPNEVRIARTAGAGPLYFAVEARFFDREEPVAPAGNELFVERRYLRLARYDTLLAGPRFERVPLTDRGVVDSGERVEVVLTVEAKNDLEYLVFEDLKPAGFEAVDLRSGGGVAVRRLRAAAGTLDPGSVDARDYAGEVRSAYRELRDRHVALFVDRLPQGLWEIRYELRAETPGEFHALPILGHAMYVPDIRGNGSELRVRLDDRLSSAP